MTSMTRVFPAFVACALLLVPAFAHAQDQNLRISFGAGVTAGAIDGEPSFSGSVGYRFSRYFSFDVEVVGALGAADRFDDRLLAFGDGREVGIGRIGSLVGRNRNGLSGSIPNLSIVNPINLRVETDGNTLLSTAGVRFLIPARGDRFQPYVSAGFGVSRTEETIRLSSEALAAFSGVPGRPGNGLLAGLDLDETTSHVGLAGTAGIGASFRVFKALSLDLDAKYYRLDRGRNLGTFGGGVSYRF
jgi:opacity protein-like surface antigen